MEFNASCVLAFTLYVMSYDDRNTYKLDTFM